MKRISIVLRALAANVHAATPNMVFVLFDDMGWSQPQCYGPKSALRTPNLDRLAQQGMRFTDAHSGAAVWTPAIDRGRSTPGAPQQNDVPAK